MTVQQAVIGVCNKTCIEQFLENPDYIGVFLCYTSFMGYITSFVFLLLYVLMQTTSIYGGDSGELVSAAYTLGIPHPPGYPLYALLGALFSHGIPFGTVAWRMGFLSSIPMAFSVFFVWKTVYLLTKGGLPCADHNGKLSQNGTENLPVFPAPAKSFPSCKVERNRTGRRGRGPGCLWQWSSVIACTLTA